MNQLKLFDHGILPPWTKKLKIEPRDYQLDAVESAFTGLCNYGGSLIRLCTGMGKTATAVMAAEKWLRKGKEYRVIVLLHELQLIRQWRDAFRDIAHRKALIEQADNHADPESLKSHHVILAMRQSLGDGRLEKFCTQKYKWLVFFDEAHRYCYSLASVQPIVDHFQNSGFIGLTATPERSDGKTLSRLFPHVASDIRIHDLDHERSATWQGWTVPIDQRFVMVESVDFKKVGMSSADYTDEELDAILNRDENMARLCIPTMDLVKDRRTIIFNPSVAMAKNVARYINTQTQQESAHAIYGSGMRNITRNEILKAHSQGKFQFLSVCGLCNEGYDDPELQAIAVFRPTKSRVRAEQMKGRGVRPWPGCLAYATTPEMRRQAIANSPKPNVMVIDLVGISGLGNCSSVADIYAESLPDEVRDRVNERIVALAQQNQAATQDEIEEIIRHEDRMAHLSDEERQALLIEAKQWEPIVRYRQREILPGEIRDEIPIRKKDGKEYYRITFGKYKGHRLFEIPDEYVRWAAFNSGIEFVRRMFYWEFQRRRKNREL